MARNNRDRLIRTFQARTTKRKPPRIMEDDPRWNASTMGNKTGYYKGAYYERGRKSRGGRNYDKGNRPG